MLDLTNRHLVMPDEVNFKVQVRPLFGEDGHRVPEHVAQGVFRTDTDHCVGTCGQRYAPQQYPEMVGKMQLAMLEAGMDLGEAKVSTSMIGNGSKLRMFWRFPNEVIAPKVGDTMERRISFISSHDQSYAFSVNIDYLRLVCLNGMTRPDFSVGHYGRHTSGFKLDTLILQLRNSLTMMGEDEALFATYAKTRLTMQQAEIFIRRTLGRLTQKRNDKTYAPRTVERIMTYYRREDSTVWGLYNAMTAWQTHHQTSGEPLTVGVQRERKVASALRSSEWAMIERGQEIEDDGGEAEADKAEGEDGEFEIAVR